MTSAIGETLRAARESANLSIVQVAEELKARPDLIQGLEAGDFSVFPAPVYARVFLRSYATFLGLDAKGLLDSLAPEPAEAPRAGSRSAPGPTARGASRPAARSGRRDRPFGPIPVPLDAPGSRGFLLPAGIALAVVAAGVSIGLVLDGGAPPAPAAPRGTPPATSVAVSAPVMVAVEAIERTWVESSVDDAAPLGVTIEPGQTQVFGANARLVLRIGNAGGVRLAHNGRSLGVPGKANQVRHLVFEREGAEDRVYRVVNGDRHAFTPSSP